MDAAEPGRCRAPQSRHSVAGKDNSVPAAHPQSQGMQCCAYHRLALPRPLAKDLLPEVDSFCCSKYFPQRLFSAPSWYVESHKKAFLVGQCSPSLRVPVACAEAGFGP